MKPSYLLPCLLLGFLAFRAQAQNSPGSFKIAFGSCSRIEDEQPVWDTISTNKPDVWIWLGDIVYADTEDMAVMKQKYDTQKAKPGYQRLRQVCQVTGIWDDHDFGRNDGGKGYPKRIESQEQLLNFLDEPQDSPRRKQKGAYAAYTFGEKGRQIKVMLLDGRYHRDTVVRVNGVMQPNPEGDILGDAQWKWFRKELKKSKAQVNIIGSGIQIIPEEFKDEKWANFPQEKRRFYELLAKSKAKGIILISGDRHHAEIMKTTVAGVPYPVYEVTSSSLTRGWKGPARQLPNKYRVGNMFTTVNFGLIEVNWQQEKPVVHLVVKDLTNTELIRETVRFE